MHALQQIFYNWIQLKWRLRGRETDSLRSYTRYKHRTHAYPSRDSCVHMEARRNLADPLLPRILTRNDTWRGEERGEEERVNHPRWNSKSARFPKVYYGALRIMRQILSTALLRWSLHPVHVGKLPKSASLVIYRFVDVRWNPLFFRGDWAKESDASPAINFSSRCASSDK